MERLKIIIRKIPIVYKLWHNYRKKKNNDKEIRKKKGYQAHGLEVLKDISQIAISNKLKLMCAWGTALGIVRDNELLPWDDDLDFILLDDSGDELSELHKLLRENDFWLYREFEENGIVTERSYIKKDVLCDIRIWRSTYEKFRTTHTYFDIPAVKYKNGMYCDYEVTYFDMVPINDVECRKFKDFQVLLPNDSEGMFRTTYGENWRIPDSNYVSQDKRYVISRKATYYKKPFLNLK